MSAWTGSSSSAPSRSTIGLSVRGLCLDLGGQRVVDGVTFDLAPGQTLGLVGPNGSGKSTLLRGLLGILPLAAGQVLIGSRDVADFRARDLARIVAAVLQDEIGDFDLDAEAVVAMGRGCHRRMFERDTEHDRAVVAQSLAALDAGHLARRPIASMSGGERQRVLVARALAQEPQVLMMDEPTNHLDVRHQFEVLALARDRGLSAVVALHDLNLAAAYCDQLLVLQRGTVVAAGPPLEVLRPGLLSGVYEVEAHVDLDHGHPHVRFRPAPR